MENNLLNLNNKNNINLIKIRIQKICIVLTTSYIYTFESQGIYRNPTEEIEVKKIKTVKTDETKSGFNFVSFNNINFTFLKYRKL